MHEEFNLDYEGEERNPHFFCYSLYYNLKDKKQKSRLSPLSLSLSSLFISFRERPKYHLPQMKLMCYVK